MASWKRQRRASSPEIASFPEMSSREKLGRRAAGPLLEQRHDFVVATVAGMVGG